MASVPVLPLTALALVVVLLVSAASAANFTCNAAAKATCAALIEYVPANVTTYAAVQTLFQVRLRDLLAANNLPLATSATKVVPPGSHVRIPFPCTCANGVGVSDNTPNYTVKAGNTLDGIARNTFSQLVTYQEIQAANSIPNANLILVGQKLTIPLPCSCDPVDDRRVVHLGHVVDAGSSVESIAAEFGTDSTTLLRLNGISDPKTLKADQLLDVPLQACSSSILNTSLDYNLLVPNGSYALTADDCIVCNCSSSSTQLDCRPIQGLSSSTCPAAMCGIGNTSTSGCEAKTCAYGGYTNATKFTILTNTTTQSTCSNEGYPKLRSKGSSWAVLLLILHATLLCFWFL